VLRLNFVRACCFLFGCYAASAQSPVGFGLKGGFPLTKPYSESGLQSGATNGRNYIVGPFAELRLDFGLSVEGDALYRPVSATNLVSTHATWEFPVLVKYHFSLPAPIVKPLVEAGPAFRAHSSDLPNLTGDGFVIGAGVEFKLPLIRLSSDLRYVRWGSGNASGSNAFPNANQVEFLVGIGF
jgi:hypothetical protein